MEQKILNEFKKKMAKKVEGLDLIISMPDEGGWEEHHSCCVMERKDNGKVWTVICSRTGNIKSIYEL